MVNCVCACGKHFQEFPSRIEQGRGKHCSRACYERSKRGTPSWNKGLPALWAFGNQWRKGKKNPKVSSMNRDRKGEKNPKWKGTAVEYRGLHTWIQRELGIPDTCEHCGKKSLKGRQIHWANKSRTYKREKSDWIRLCVKCHRKYDSSVS